MRGMDRNLATALVLLIFLGYPGKSGAVEFAPPKTYPVGTTPLTIVIGDFNGDGKPDIAVANSGSNNVSILLGNGDGTYQPVVNFDAGNSPESIATGDFNGDGKLDLAVFQPGDYGNSVAGSVSILLGNGDGSFRTPQTLTFSPSVSFLSRAQMTVGDFNLDQKSDLILTSVEFDSSTAVLTLSIFLSKGDGTFQSPTQIPVPKQFPVPSLPSDPQGVMLAVGDFNGDLKPDVAVVTPLGLLILLGKGDGTFMQSSTVPFNHPGTIIIRDLNHDGNLDVILHSTWSTVSNPNKPNFRGHESLRVLLGNGDGSFQTEQIIATDDHVLNFSGSRMSDVVVGDFNADGEADIGYRRTSYHGSAGNSYALEILLGNGKGDFSSPIVLSDLGYGLVADNLNSDKLSDLVALTASNEVAVLLNTSPTSGADLGIIQPGVSPALFTAGDNVTYSARVLNEGPHDASGVTFTDTLPNGVNFVSATATQGSCIQSNGIVSCTLGSLADGAEAHVTIVASPTALGTVTNSMNVTATEPDLAPANNNAVQTSVGQPVYVLTVTKSGSGSGSVSATKGRNGPIDCGSTCSARYLGGAVVTLNATPSATSEFASWSGACTGADPNDCSVTLDSDQSVTATFNAVPDFSLNPAASSLTVQRGGQASDLLTFPAQGGFTGSIALTCSVNGPAPMPTCGVSPASVTPGTNATLTVNTAALSAALATPWFKQGARLYAAWLPLGLLGCVLTTGFDKKRRRMWALCLFLMAATILPAACGGGSNTPPPVQSYTVTVTATSGAIQHSTAISVTVQ